MPRIDVLHPSGLGGQFYWFLSLQPQPGQRPGVLRVMLSVPCEQSAKLCNTFG